mgnify:FL=1
MDARSCEESWSARNAMSFGVYSLGAGGCDDSSTGPPCTGWVAIMVPVFSRAAWRCSWGMVQNDLVHVWCLNHKLGYCAHGANRYLEQERHALASLHGVHVADELCV